MAFVCDKCSIVEGGPNLGGLCSKCSGEAKDKNRGTSLVPLDLLVMPFSEEKYLDELWECYRNGVDNEGHPKKILFIALIADLLKQTRGEKVNRKEKA